MRLVNAIPYAWRFVTNDRPRLIRSLCGITFAALLILLQLGFRSGLLASSAEIIRYLDADIVIQSEAKGRFFNRERIPDERIYQVRSVPGIADATPMYFAYLGYKNFDDGTVRPIRVLGFDPRARAFNHEQIVAQAPMLTRSGAALVDDKSRETYGTIGVGPAEVERRHLDVVGTYSIGADFNAEGSLIVSDETFFELTDGARGQAVNFVLARVVPGADLLTVLAAVRDALPRDSVAHGRQELWQVEFDYWDSQMPVSDVFFLGTIVAFLVGIVIFYQILFTQISDYLPQYATMKAIGFSDVDIVSIVMLQALMLSVVGYVVAVVLGVVMYAVTAAATGLPIDMTLDRVLILFVLTVSMSVVAGLLALRRVLRADPAEVFG